MPETNTNSYSIEHGGWKNIDGVLKWAQPKIVDQTGKELKEQSNSDSSSINDYINSTAKKHKVDPDLASALIEVESHGDQKAKSSKGAIGMTQLMPGTARELGVDPNNAKENISGGIRYIRQHLDSFGGDNSKALAAYNAGAGAVKRLIKRFGDKWREHLPTETKQYITKVETAIQQKSFRGKGASGSWDVAPQTKPVTQAPSTTSSAPANTPPPEILSAGVQVQGPDKKIYQFPNGTTKEKAIAYFKSKGIRGEDHSLIEKSKAFIEEHPSIKALAAGVFDPPGAASMAVGAGVGTLAGPVAGGAAYGASDALLRGKGTEDVLKEGAYGAAGGAVLKGASKILDVSPAVAKHVVSFAEEHNIPITKVISLFGISKFKPLFTVFEELMSKEKVAKPSGEVVDKALQQAKRIEGLLRRADIKSYEQVLRPGEKLHDINIAEIRDRIAEIQKAKLPTINNPNKFPDPTKGYSGGKEALEDQTRNDYGKFIDGIKAKRTEAKEAVKLSMERTKASLKQMNERFRLMETEYKQRADFESNRDFEKFTNAQKDLAKREKVVETLHKEAEEALNNQDVEKAKQIVERQKLHVQNLEKQFEDVSKEDYARYKESQKISEEASSSEAKIKEAFSTVDTPKTKPIVKVDTPKESKGLTQRPQRQLSIVEKAAKAEDSAHWGILKKANRQGFKETPPDSWFEERTEVQKGTTTTKKLKEFFKKHQTLGGVDIL